MSRINHIGIVGGGAWGTALAAVAALAGRQATLWAREAEVVRGLNETRQNPVFLPGIDLPPGIRATNELAQLGGCDAILLVAPAQFARKVAADLRAHLRAGVPVVICAKGIEQDTELLLSEVLARTLPDQPLAVLSGPTFAAEVARGLPTAVTLACADETLGAALVEALGQATFRPYLSADVIGAEIGGAMKNVLAIACGVVAGKNLGENARAALITRGMAEILRLGRAKGAQPETLMGLSGLGDLILTCSSPQSRNMSLGMALGQGQALAGILASRNSVAEGVFTAGALAKLAARLNIDLPISAAVDAILHQGADIDDTIRALMSRPFKFETL